MDFSTETVVNPGVIMDKHNFNLLHRSLLPLAAIVALSACDGDYAPAEHPLTVGAPEEFTPVELGLGDDWTRVESGLWSRIGAEGDEQFLGIGAAGNRHVRASLEAVEAQLASDADLADSEESRAQLAEIRGFMASLDDSPLIDPTPLAPRCAVVMNMGTWAAPIACGAQGSASVYYSNGCSSVAETIKTYTKATCGYTTATNQCGPQTGNPVTCFSYAPMTGTGPCDSYALAQSTYYASWSVNTQRGACP